MIRVWRDEAVVILDGVVAKLLTQIKMSVGATTENGRMLSAEAPKPATLPTLLRLALEEAETRWAAEQKKKAEEEAKKAAAAKKRADLEKERQRKIAEEHEKRIRELKKEAEDKAKLKRDTEKFEALQRAKREADERKQADEAAKKVREERRAEERQKEEAAAEKVRLDKKEAAERARQQREAEEERVRLEEQMSREEREAKLAAEKEAREAKLAAELVAASAARVEARKREEARQQAPLAPSKSEGKRRLSWEEGGREEGSPPPTQDGSSIDGARDGAGSCSSDGQAERPESPADSQPSCNASSGMGIGSGAPSPASQLSAQRLKRSQSRHPSGELGTAIKDLKAIGAPDDEEVGAGEKRALGGITFWSTSQSRVHEKAIEHDQKGGDGHGGGEPTSMAPSAGVAPTTAPASRKGTPLVVVQEDPVIANLIAQCKLIEPNKKISLAEIHRRFQSGDLDKTSLKTELRLLIGRQNVQSALLAMAQALQEPPARPRSRSSSQEIVSESEDDECE